MERYKTFTDEQLKEIKDTINYCLATPRHLIKALIILSLYDKCVYGENKLGELFYLIQQINDERGI